MNWKRISLRQLAGVVTTQLSKHGIDAVLVGGAVVTIYSERRYLSYDLDMATDADLRHIRPAMKELGFVQKTGRHFEHPTCRFFVEFVAPPIGVGADPIRRFSTLKTKSGMIRLLTPTDSVRDRLAAYFHWNDQPSLKQAILVAKRHRIHWKVVREWSKREGHLEKYEQFRKRVTPAATP